MKKACRYRHALLFVEVLTLYLTISVFISGISPFGKSKQLLSYYLFSHYSAIRMQFENIKSVIQA